MNRLIVTTLDNALRVARKTLYKHSNLVLYHAECQDCFHICSIGIRIPLCGICNLSSEYRYRFLVVVLHESVITFAISDRILVFLKASLITERATVSFLGIGVALICLMVKSRSLVGVEKGSLLIIVLPWETKLVFSTIVKL